MILTMAKKTKPKSSSPNTQRAEKLIKVTEKTHQSLKIGAARRNMSIGKLITDLAEEIEK